MLSVVLLATLLGCAIAERVVLVVDTPAGLWPDFHPVHTFVGTSAHRSDASSLCVSEAHTSTEWTLPRRPHHHRPDVPPSDPNRPLQVAVIQMVEEETNHETGRDQAGHRRQRGDLCCPMPRLPNTNRNNASAQSLRWQQQQRRRQRQRQRQRQRPRICRIVKSHGVDRMGVRNSHRRAM